MGGLHDPTMGGLHRAAIDTPLPSPGAASDFRNERKQAELWTAPLFRSFRKSLRDGRRTPGPNPQVPERCAVIQRRRRLALCVLRPTIGAASTPLGAPVGAGALRCSTFRHSSAAALVRRGAAVPHTRTYAPAAGWHLCPTAQRGRAAEAVPESTPPERNAMAATLPSLAYIRRRWVAYMTRLWVA